MTTAIITLVLLFPGLASAAAAGSSAEPSGATSLVTAITALLSAVAALVAAIRGARKAKSADESAARAVAQATAAGDRATAAEAWADRLANAHQDGVVLVLSYPGTRAACRGLLEANGWRVAYYQVTQAELDRGALLPGPHVIADVCAADALVIEGLDVAGVARLAGMREVRDSVRSGASVVLYTGGLNHRYDLTAWSECDQATNVPVTTEAAVRASLARREVIARRQGVRPGQVAAAREQLLSGRDA